MRANADREVTVIVADAQRQAQELRGKGDAAATEIYAKAYGKDQKFYAFYRSLEAYRNALSGKDTSFVLTPDSQFFRFFQGWQGAPSAPSAAAGPLPSPPSPPAAANAGGSHSP